MPIESLIENINSDPELDGITITGGEPLDQFEPVSGLCSRLFGRTNIFLTTGYTVTDILLKGLAGIFKLTDILCAGPFEEDKICSGEWKGSSNQVILYLTESGEKQSLLPVVKKEYHIDSSGIIKTGFTR